MNQAPELVQRGARVNALHICGDELIEARELERSIQEGDEYKAQGLLTDLLA